MSKFAIRPRRYRDQLDAISDVLLHARERNIDIDIGQNPNGKYSLLAWAYDEILRLRAQVGGVPEETLRSKLLPGPRPVAESKPITVEET